MKNNPVDAWLVAKTLNELVWLDELLSEDAIFVSPFHGIPQVGRQAAKLQITGIMKLLAAGEHKYVRRIVGPHDAMLEFESSMDGLKLNGVEILKWNEDCKITEVRVMLRPLDVASDARSRLEKLLLSKKSAT
jgi:hypothetical protein